MGCIIEFFMEFIFEVVFEGTIAIFYACAKAFVPEKQKLGKKGQFAATLVAVAMFVSLFVGVILLIASKGKSKWGIILLAVPVLFIVTAVGFALKNRKNKDD